MQQVMLALSVQDERYTQYLHNTTFRYLFNLAIHSTNREQMSEQINLVLTCASPSLTLHAKIYKEILLDSISGAILLEGEVVIKDTHNITNAHISRSS